MSLNRVTRANGEITLPVSGVKVSLNYEYINSAPSEISWSLTYLVGSTNYINASRAGDHNNSIKMYIPTGSRVAYLVWSDAGTNYTYTMSWVYYSSSYNS